MYVSNLTEEKVLSDFGSINCAQAVFGEFSPQMGLERETALKIASNFGGGMKEGETCGAVTGALMVLGLKYGQGEDCDPDAKNIMLEKAADFKRKFVEKHGSCICKELLGYKIPEEMPQIMAENKFGTLCCKLVVDACEICEDILNDG